MRSYELQRPELARAEDANAARMGRYEKRLTPEELLDKFHPGWRDRQSSWPPKNEKCPCERCKNQEVM